jgi:uncharacterized phage protein (TIGR01671 family)
VNSTSSALSLGVIFAIVQLENKNIEHFGVLKMADYNMRNQICRAKRIDNNEWVEGYYVFDECDLIVKDLRAAVRGLAELVNVYPIKRKTIGRAVCRNDKNGKPIFEGDIVNGYGIYPYIVRYGEFNEKVGLGYYYGIGFYLEYIKDSTHKVPLSSISCDKGEFEVVGNIYDNPERLVVED